MGFVQEKKNSAIEIHCILPLFSWPRRRCERHFFAYVHSFLHNNKWKMMPKYIINYNFRIHWASPTVRSNTNQLFLLAKSGPTEKCRFARIGLKILWRLWTKTKVLGPKTKRHQNLNTLMTKCNADHNIYPSTTRAPREKKIIKKKSLLTIFSTTMWHISHFLSKDCNFKNCRKRKHEKRNIHIIFRQCNYPLIMTLVS